MIRFHLCRPTADCGGGRNRWKWAGMAVLVTALSAPCIGVAADWLAPASDQTVSAT